MQLLLTRPRHDIGTYYLYVWSEKLIEEATKRGVQLITVDRKKVNLKNIQGYLEKQPTNIVIINGHGNEQCVCGHENEEIINLKNCNLLKGKKIYVRACSSAVMLGKESIKNGAEGFIGYLQPFIFPREKDSTNNPLEDELAAPILECSNQIGISLLKGKTIEEAHRDSLQKYEEKINEYSTSKYDRASVLPFLMWNRDCQVCLK